ncbi:DUF1304 domain-containing protein [Actinorhabdospora filicis]|nr:DUF1304 domain-containing protein [Actinorhabdospora filicis]
MNVVAVILALVAAAVHVLIFVLEAVLFPRDAKVRARFRVAPADAEGVRPWAFNQGFYNLFLAVGVVIGVVTGERVLVAFCCGSMVAAALVLVVTDRRMLQGAVVQGLVPLAALALLWV